MSSDGWSDAAQTSTRGVVLPDTGAVTAGTETALARAIASAVIALPAVNRLAEGHRILTATYGPGETVRGVAVREIGRVLDVEVSVVATYTHTLDLRVLAEKIRTIVRGVVAGDTSLPIGRIDVTIADLQCVEDKNR